MPNQAASSSLIPALQRIVRKEVSIATDKIIKANRVQIQRLRKESSSSDSSDSSDSSSGSSSSSEKEVKPPPAKKSKPKPRIGYILNNEEKNIIREYITTKYPGALNFERRFANLLWDCEHEDTPDADKRCCSHWNKNLYCPEPGTHEKDNKVYEHVCTNCLAITNRRQNHKAANENCPINQLWKEMRSN